MRGDPVVAHMVRLASNGFAGNFHDPPDAVYGCKDWQNCESRGTVPPYNPTQPQKCETHRKYMRTLIEADAR